jgi:hypothetical protein
MRSSRLHGTTPWIVLSVLAFYSCSGGGTPVTAVGATSTASSPSTSSTANPVATTSTPVAATQPAVIIGHPTVAIVFDRPTRREDPAVLGIAVVDEMTGVAQRTLFTSAAGESIVGITLSPDGHRVVFGVLLGRTGPHSPCGAELRSADLTTGEIRQIAVGLAPVVSPDGSRIAYLAPQEVTRPSPGGGYTECVYTTVVVADSSGVTQFAIDSADVFRETGLELPAGVRELHWSPLVGWRIDGSLLVAAVCGSCGMGEPRPPGVIASWLGGREASVLTDDIVILGERFIDPYDVKRFVATDGTSVLRERVGVFIQSATGTRELVDATEAAWPANLHHLPF